MITERNIPWNAESQLVRTIGDSLGTLRLDDVVRQFMAMSPLEQLAVAYLECAKEIPVGNLPPAQILSLGQIVAIAEFLPAD